MILAGGAFDGKRMRKAIQRKTVDYFTPVMRHMQLRKIFKQPKMLQPDPNFVIDVSFTF